MHVVVNGQRGGATTPISRNTNNQTSKRSRGLPIEQVQGSGRTYGGTGSMEVEQLHVHTRLGTRRFGILGPNWLGEVHSDQCTSQPKSARPTLWEPGKNQAQ